MTLSFYFRYMSPSVPFVSCLLTPLLEVFLAVIRITVILFSIRMWCLVWILMICKPKTCTCIYNWRNPVIFMFVYIFWKFDVPDWWTKEQCKTAVRMWKVWSHFFFISITICVCWKYSEMSRIEGACEIAVSIASVPNGYELLCAFIYLCWYPLWCFGVYLHNNMLESVMTVSNHVIM